MIVYMTEEQARELGKFLIAYRNRLEEQAGRPSISWEELGEPVGLDGSLLGKFSRGERLGMNWQTTIQLTILFGPHVLEILGVDLKASPYWKLEGQGE